MLKNDKIVPNLSAIN